MLLRLDGRAAKVNCGPGGQDRPGRQLGGLLLSLNGLLMKQQIADNLRVSGRMG